MSAKSMTVLILSKDCTGLILLRQDTLVTFPEDHAGALEVPVCDVPYQVADERARAPEQAEPEVASVRRSITVCTWAIWVNSRLCSISFLETEGDMGIAGILLPSGFPFDLWYV